MVYALHVCQSEFNTDNDSSVTAEPNRGELGREADRVGGSGNGSNHGRIRVELSRRRIIIVSWHRSVVPFPAHHFSFLILVSLHPRARAHLFIGRVARIKCRISGYDSAQTDAAMNALYEALRMMQTKCAKWVWEMRGGAFLPNLSRRVYRRVSSLASYILWR